MLTFFPSLIVALIWCSIINNRKLRRAAQSLVVIIYAMLGAMYP